MLEQLYFVLGVVWMTKNSDYMSRGELSLFPRQQYDTVPSVLSRSDGYFTPGCPPSPSLAAPSRYCLIIIINIIIIFFSCYTFIIIIIIIIRAVLS